VLERQKWFGGFVARRPLWSLAVLGVTQLLLWSVVTVESVRFAPGNEFGQRPLLLVTGLLTANFLLYFVSLGIAWNPTAIPENGGSPLRIVLFVAFLFRLTLWWSQPIQEADFYRYLWDGRVLAVGVNPYSYSPAQVEFAPEAGAPRPDLERLTNLLCRSPEVQEIFSRIDHRTVPTIYPPLSQAVFAAAACVTPERSSVLTQVRMLKLVLAIFDFATIVLVIGLLRNLGQPAGRALAYAWCPLVLKEFANSGHLDSIAVCLTTVTLWLLTRRRGDSGQSSAAESGFRPAPVDWLASIVWAGAVLAKLYPLVLAPVLLAYWWRRLRWGTIALLALFSFVLVAGYSALPPVHRAAKIESAAAAEHSSFTGLAAFASRWEMNDLLFSVGYENIRPLGDEANSHKPWYSVMPGGIRETVTKGFGRFANVLGLKIPGARIAFIFAQALMGGMVLGLSCWLATRRWPEDPREELLRRAFLCLAWLWFLSATQNPWYWTWALPLAVFASRPWLLVSGFTLIYYLRFWFVNEFPHPTLPGGFTGQRFFDEGVVWIEHLPPLLAIVVFGYRRRTPYRAREARAFPTSGSQLALENGISFPGSPRAMPENVAVIIPALNEEASLPGVIARLRKLGLNHIRVVDNGSRDRTAEIARECGAEVLSEPKRGYGQACWTGCKNLPADVEWILFCNADGSDDIERVSAMMRATENGAEFILGSRVSKGKRDDHLTVPQRFGNRLATALVRLLWHADYADLGPLRLISRRAFERLNMQDRGFGWTVEMQVRAVEEGVKVAEVQVRNFPRSAGVSKISGTVKGSIQAGTMILSTIASLWLRRLRI